MTRPSWLRTLARDPQVLAGAVLVGVSLVMLYRTREWAPLRPAVSPDPRAIRLTAPPRRCAAADLVFRWRPVAGAARYRLDVFDETLETVLQRADLAEAELALGPEAWRKLRPGRTYSWWVEALDERGERLAASPRAVVTVEGP